MPTRNLVVIIFAAILSYVCYLKAQHNRFANLFAEAVGRVSSEYVEKVDQRELFEGAMQGMLSGLDPYSSYIGLREYSEFKESLDQEFGGIGIIVSPNQETKRLMVLSPVVGTPAHRAGIMAGDMILEVNGESIEGFTLPETVDLLRGAPGTDVRVKVQHRGDDIPEEITITRAIIQVPSVLGDTLNPDGSWQFYLKKNPDIGYIRLNTFGEHTVDELQSALETLKGKDLVGLIIDVRSNAGGLLAAAIATCDLFIDHGVIVSTRGREGVIRDVEKATRRVVVDSKIPMAVLVNKYSASASEIVAACLQDHERAVIIGERTWGKGTVQNVISLEMGKSMIKLTTATFWRPSARNIHRSKDAGEEEDWGVVPNDGFEVKLTEEEFRKVVRARRESDYGPFDDIEASAKDDGSIDENQAEEESTESNDSPDSEEEPFEDPQLRRAIEYIEQQASIKHKQAEAA